MKSKIFYKKGDGYDNKISYAVGQGIGLYSSWASLALTHHIIIRHSAFLAGKPGFEDYLVLGDDVVIADKEVASNYVKVITGLGVKISLSKSILPGKFSGVEFASKLIVGNLNLSPLPLGLILRSDVPRKLSLLSHITTRIIQLGMDSFIAEKEDLILTTIIRKKVDSEDFNRLVRVFAHSVIFDKFLNTEFVKGDPLRALLKSSDFSNYPFEVVSYL